MPRAKKRKVARKKKKSPKKRMGLFGGRKPRRAARAKHKKRPKTRGRKMRNPFAGMMAVFTPPKARGRTFETSWGLTILGGVLLISAALYLGHRVNENITVGSKPYKQHFSKAQKLDMSGRIDYWSNFVAQRASKRRKLAALGKGPKIEDFAPLIPRNYDCTTYVETVAALSRSKRAYHFFDNLVEIRYRNGRGRFSHRNHFPTADWIPNNVRSGILTDITQRIAAKASVSAKTAEKTIKRERWLKRLVESGKVKRSLASVAEKSWEPKVKASVDYIPVQRLKKAMKHIPNGAVLNLVRGPSVKMDVMVSHQGFAIRKGNTIYLRHASTNGRIQTVPLNQYLGSLDYRKWPVVGININRINN